MKQWDIAITMNDRTTIIHERITVREGSTLTDFEEFAVKAGRDGILMDVGDKIIYYPGHSIFKIEPSSKEPF